MLVLQQMVIFVLLMLVGAWARKKQIFTEENQSQITQLVLNIAYPVSVQGVALTTGAAVVTMLLVALAVGLG